MPDAISIKQLKAVKERFGGLVSLDLTAHDLISAHRALGADVHAQVHKILGNRLGRLSDEHLALMLRQAAECEGRLARLAEEPGMNPLLRAASREYLACLGAWAQGAKLEGFLHPRLAVHQPASKRLLAMFLQHDASGCQTGFYRQADGAVILWHTEEDVEEAVGDGFDRLRLATFLVQGEKEPVKLHAFIYPDLLPGPAFGWREDGYTQAVDSLHTRALPELRGGILANVASWITLRLGAAVNPGEVIAALQPYYDGYALNAMYSRQGMVWAEKYEFAGDFIQPYKLDEQPGSWLFQANIFCHKEHPKVQSLEDLSPETWQMYHQRVERTRKALAGSADGSMEYFFRLMSSRAGGGWAYANPYVKAYFLQRLSPLEAETWVGHGAATLAELSLHRRM